MYIYIYMYTYGHADVCPDLNPGHLGPELGVTNFLLLALTKRRWAERGCGVAMILTATK